MPTAPVNGTSLHYLDAGPRGARDAVLLLHAFPLHSGMWARQLTALFPRHRAIAPDYRGLGQTPPSGEHTSMELLASDVQALLAHLRIERVAVVGLSMGGYLAFELFRLDRKLFRGLVLCDTRANADSEEGRANRETSARNALERGLSWVADDMVPKLLHEGADPAQIREVRELVRGGTPAGVAAAQRCMAGRSDSTELLAEIACPSLVVVGELDRFVPVADAEKLAASLKSGRLVVIPGAGHLPCIEAPAAFNRVLLEFVDGLPA